MNRRSNASAHPQNGHRRSERVRQIHVGAAVMVRSTAAGPEILLAQRPPGEALAGFWEFPGGKLEAGETALHAVVREVREELGVDVEAIALLAQETHLYPHGLQVVLSFVHCTVPTGQLQPLDGQAFRWVLLTDVNPDEMLEADRPFIRRLIANEGVGGFPQGLDGPRPIPEISSMAYVITDACISVKDQSCVQECPVDCIKSDEASQQYFIDPDICIDCGACQPVCPVNAIYPADEVPADQQHQIQINADYFKQKQQS